MKAPSKSFLLSLLCVLLVATTYPSFAIPTCPSPWTSYGLQPGITTEEAVELLGEPEFHKVPIDDDHYYDSATWSSDISAAFEEQEAAILTATALEFNGIPMNRNRENFTEYSFRSL